MTRIFHWFFMWKMDPMSVFDIRLVFTLPPRDSTLQYKRLLHLWYNFPCITTFMQIKLPPPAPLQCFFPKKIEPFQCYLWKQCTDIKTNKLFNKIYIWCSSQRKFKENMFSIVKHYWEISNPERMKILNFV